MSFRIKNKKMFAISGVISFIYHFPFLLNDWVNVYLLERKVEWIKYIIDFHEEILATMLGMICYFHLFAVHFTATSTVFTKIWTIFSFVLIWFLIKKALEWFFKRKTKVEKLQK